MIRLSCLALALGLSLCLAVTTPARATETPLDGKQLFANSCGFCHSKGGRKAGKGPKLANSPRSDDYIIKRIKKGKQGRMPAYARAFDDTKLKAILAYIRSLDEPAQ